MGEESKIDVYIIFLGICLLLLFFAMIYVKLILNVYIPFSRKREFIRSKIICSYGEKKAHWRKELFRLYLKLIPVIGPVIANISRKIERKRGR